MDSVFNFGLYFKPLIYCFRKKNRTASYCLVNRLREEIELTRLQCKASTNKNKVTAVNTLDRFVREKELDYLTVGSITADHIRAFERWALDEGFKPNYVALHMRCLRALFNRINGSGKELFKHVRTTNSQTEKRAVSETVIKHLREMTLPVGSTLDLARDVFLFCFLCMGMPLIDAAFLKKSQYSGGYICYIRQKTNRMVKIKVGYELQQLIQRLSADNSPYLLPILTSVKYNEAMRQYKRFYQRYRRSLQQIAARMGGDVRLTSYTARHTWASIAYTLGIDINTISQALAHASTRITDVYIKELCNSRLYAANEAVLNAIM